MLRCMSRRIAAFAFLALAGTFLSSAAQAQMPREAIYDCRHHEDARLTYHVELLRDGPALVYGWDLNYTIPYFSTGRAWVLAYPNDQAAPSFAIDQATLRGSHVTLQGRPFPIICQPAERRIIR